MALATSRIPLSGTFVGSSYAKRPVNSSMPGASDSPKPKNFPLSLRMMGRKSRVGITAPHRAEKSIDRKLVVVHFIYQYPRTVSRDFPTSLV